MPIYTTIFIIPLWCIIKVFVNLALDMYMHKLSKNIDINANNLSNTRQKF